MKTQVGSHPLSAIFPPMTDEEFQGLVEDVREHGLIEPVTLFEGKILDGNSRYLACLESGAKPGFEDFKGDDPLGFVISKNLKRRHLNESQRALVAASIAKARGPICNLRPIGRKSRRSKPPRC